MQKEKTNVLKYIDDIVSLGHKPDLSSRSDPARSTTTSLLFLTIGALNSLTICTPIPFSFIAIKSPVCPLICFFTLTYN